MMYAYEVKGVDSGEQTWSVAGNVLAGDGADAREICDTVGKAAFAELTQGRAVYGAPGKGCRGPYKLTSFKWEAVKQ